MSTRRSFLLGSLPSLALISLTPAVAKTPAKRGPLYLRPTPHEANDPDYCACDACKEVRVNSVNHGLTCKAILALDVLDAAQGRFLREHCGEQGVENCDACADVSGLRWALGHGKSAIEALVIPPDDMEPFSLFHRPTAVPTGEVGLALGVALYDALDSLLLLVEGHCQIHDCLVCEDSGVMAHHISEHLDLMYDSLPRTEPMHQRRLASAQLRAAINGRDGWSTDHTVRVCAGAEDDIAHIHRLIANCKLFS